MRNCDHCRQPIKKEERLYHCLDCNDFDLCLQCFTTQGHPHFMSEETTETLETWSRRLAWFQSPANLLNQVFLEYAKRPMFGVSIKKKDSSKATSASQLTHILNGTQTPRPYLQEKATHEHCPSEQNIHWITYRSTHIIAKSLGSSLSQLLPKGSLIGICAPHAPQFFFADIACAFFGYPIVLLPQKMSDQQLCSILQETQVRLVFCIPSEKQRFINLQKKARNIDHIVEIDEQMNLAQVHLLLTPKQDPPQLSPKESLTETSNAPLFWDMSTLIQYGLHFPQEFQPAEQDALAFVAYTSGSTGSPKGVTFNHQQWRRRLFKPLASSVGTTVRFLPFSSESSRTGSYVSIVNGGRLGFHNSAQMHGLYETFQLFRPTYISSVPRLWNQVYHDYQAALAIAHQQEPKADHTQIEAKVKNSFKNLLGGRATYLLSGGAPIAPQILDTLSKLFDCLAKDGYGLTETGSISFEKRIKPNVDFKLINVPELDYYTTDKPFPRGELCVKTREMFSGYWNPKDNHNRFVDGWFMTGDIVAQIAFRKIKLIERKNHVYKLAQGIFVAPEKLETLYNTSPFISQMYVHCDALRHHLVAVVIPDQTVLDIRLRKVIEKGIHSQTQSSSNEDASIKEQAKDARTIIRQELSRIAIKSNLEGFEQIRAVHLDTQAFTKDNGLLTRTSKQNRKAIAAHYQKQIENLYKEIDHRDTRSQIIDFIKQLLPTPMKTIPNQNGKDSAPRLDQLGIDSMTALHLRSSLLEQFKLNLPTQWLLESPSIEEIADYIEKGFPTSSSNALDLMKEDLAQSESTQTISSEKCSSPFQKTRSILFTGATGFLGCHLLREWLHTDPTLTIYCLIRAKDKEHAFFRLKQACQKQQVWSYTWSQQLEVIVGDLSKPALGLSNDKFNNLAQTVDTIVHNGAQVNHLLPYKKLQATNVLGTKSLLQLAKQGSHKAFHFISSISAIPATHLSQDQYTESPLQLDQESIQSFKNRNGYSQSKYVSERLVQCASQKGLSCYIYRPGTLAPHSESGVFNEKDTFTRIINACIEHRSVPKVNSQLSLNIIPVNLASQAIVRLSQVNSERESIFHIIHPYGNIAWLDIFQKLLQTGTCQQIPYQEWMSKNQSNPSTNHLENTEQAKSNERQTNSLQPASLQPLLHRIKEQLPTEHLSPTFQAEHLHPEFPKEDQKPIHSLLNAFIQRLMSNQKSI